MARRTAERVPHVLRDPIGMARHVADLAASTGPAADGTAAVAGAWTDCPDPVGAGADTTPCVDTAETAAGTGWVDGSCGAGSAASGSGGAISPMAGDGSGTNVSVEAGPAG